MDEDYDYDCLDIEECEFDGMIEIDGEVFYK